MIIKTTSTSDCKEHDVTDENVYHQRRELIKKMGFLGAGSLLSSSAGASILDIFRDDKIPSSLFSQNKLDYKAINGFDEELTPEAKITGHNNFYEFGVEKQQPAELSQSFNVNPWTLKISGEVENSLTLGYDELYSSFDLEERIYRLRCVEAWSMVVPWIGFSLADLVKKAKPTSRAKYLAFETLYDPVQMPGQRSRRLGGGIDYPYIEGLRIDEAMNPLALMSVGLYGKTLPPQNGAPIRLIVPWKYGFKSIKSIVGIKFVERQPATTWNLLAANEYGFYANVNPTVDHPRWSQASERRITTGGIFSQNRIPTLPFNGYGEQVADLYSGMNLRKYY
ncbi:MAG: protein-methionine-sulfoxide reductase catalytic subunit MsrP [Proteobacteria bacterium]|nr:protein-methionine-sulfoxide reductase catalytic subunit MsrP [Pseudomonadota bacterium]MDA1351219.1 protein-methionine-sulfoxide reductase catalytic subunit MsrP [Pseudomonadota bacterium]